jgi:hypothetical protein
MASAMRATVLSKIFFIVCRLRFQIPCAPVTTYHCSPQCLSPARYITGETEGFDNLTLFPPPPACCTAVAFWPFATVWSAPGHVRSCG